MVNNAMEGYDFRQVSVTALVPAFARGEYTEIPWAKEMLAVLRDRGATLSSIPWSDGARGYASLFEARFRAVSRLVEEKGATQVLELAAGLSPRGMEFAQRGVVYVEADLAESMTMKREVVTAILGSVPDSLHLCAASVIDRAQLLACCSPFDSGRPVAVTMEGLLRYLTFEEKAQLAANVSEILRRYGGWWVTPDIHLKSWAERQSSEYRQSERELLGRSLDSNYFADLDHAQEFFEHCGFTVDSRPLLEGIRDQIGQQNEELIDELADRRIFVLTLKS
ncbi:MAG TPA: class I SAM-dependent methyltransferase [Bryobacteraceae bacterium]|nr:class I SAM-dependent methyltransferase [Bryobacteraceae bacterium]